MRQREANSELSFACFGSRPFRAPLSSISESHHQGTMLGLAIKVCSNSELNMLGLVLSACSRSFRRLWTKLGGEGERGGEEWQDGY